MKASGLVSTSEIAELVNDVSSAATVSNWRKRYPDFPQPVNEDSAPGTRRPLFRWAEVRDWLEATGREFTEPVGASGSGLTSESLAELEQLRFEGDEHLSPFLACSLIAVASLGKRFGSTVAIDGTLHLSDLRGDLQGQLRDNGFPQPPLPAADLFDPRIHTGHERFAPLVRELLSLDEDQLCSLFDDQLDGGAGRRVALRKEVAGLVTSHDTVDLFSALVSSQDLGSKASFLDPACGTGRLLIDCATSVAGNQRTLRCVGNDLVPLSAAIAWQRSVVFGVPVKVTVGDCLLEDPPPFGQFDVVIADPPFGRRRSNSREATELKRPPRLIGASLDMEWLELCAEHLTPNGRAYVLLPASSLSRGGRDATVRRELIRSGAVEAVITLPMGTGSNQARVGQCIWILRSRAADARNPVLLVDGTEELAGSDDAAHALGETIRAWRSGRWLSDDDVPDAIAGVCSVQPVIELVGTSASLQPVQWISSTTSAEDREALLAKAEENARLLGGLSLPSEGIELAQEIPNRLARSGGADWKKVRELIAAGQADLLRSVSERRQKEQRREGDAVELGLWLAEDFYEGATPDAPGSTVSLAERRAQRLLTQPGDLVVGVLHGAVTAIVDRLGGNVIAWPLVGLRVDPEYLPPEVAAAALQAPRNRDIARKVTGPGSAGQARIEELELPALSPEAADSVAEALKSLASIRGAGQQMVTAARVITDALVEVGEDPK